MVKKANSPSPTPEKPSTEPICSNCGSKMEQKGPGRLVCSKCGNEERGD